MKRLLLFSILFFLSFFLGAQTTVNLSFTGRDSAAWAQLDSIRVTNLSQGGDTLLHWPDTVLSYISMGVDIGPAQESYFQITKCFPNPSVGPTSLTLYLPGRDLLMIRTVDVLGRTIMQDEWILDKGHHTLLIQLPEDGIYLLSACWQNQWKTVKLIQQGGGESNAKLEHIAFTPNDGFANNKARNTGFTITPEDTILICGFSGGIDKYIQDKPTTSKIYTLQFGYNVPCEMSPNFTYGGQTYTTVQIGNQCWMKENLNIGTVVNSVFTANHHSDVSNNGVIEKYCYDNILSYCTTYGGLYDWREAMGYVTTIGSQGICPTNWHIPSNAEWNTLVNFLGGSNVAGGKMKESGAIYWPNPNAVATNSSGFSGLPGGYRSYDGSFDNWGTGHFWSSSSSSFFSVQGLFLYFWDQGVHYINEHSTFGYSVRCIKD